LSALSIESIEPAMYTRSALASFVLLIAFLAGPAAAQFNELAKKIPVSANAVAFVNVEKLMDSPVAKQLGWAKNRDKAFATGVSFLPPDSRHAVLAMELDLNTWVTMWEAAILELDHNPDPKKVAEMSGGAIDTIEGLTVVDLPSDAYLVRFAADTGAFMAPANRQSVSRWLKQVKTKDDLNVSGYIFEAYKFANDRGTPVVMALDLENAFPETAVLARLLQPQSQDFLKKYNLDAARVANTVAGVRGITFGITFGDKPFGKVKIDFQDEVTMTPEIAKVAMIHVFSTHGVLLDEFLDWKPEVSGKSISLEGFVTPSGMRRVSSLFNRPPSLKMPASAGDVVPKTKEEKIKEASVNYFHQVEDQLKDLKLTKQGAQVSTMGSYGVWMSKYANKIDQLSVLNVDPELVSFGAYVSDSLRGGYNAIRSGAAKSRIREVNTPMQYDYYTQTNTYGYTYRDSWWGGGGGPVGDTSTYAVPDQQAYAHARAAVRTEERIASGNQARDSVQGIEKATGDIRRAMTQKYGVDF
jgi:hypothetical protein